MLAKVSDQYWSMTVDFQEFCREYLARVVEPEGRKYNVVLTKNTAVKILNLYLIYADEQTLKDMTEYFEKTNRKVSALWKELYEKMRKYRDLP